MKWKPFQKYLTPIVIAPFCPPFGFQHLYPSLWVYKKLNLLVKVTNYFSNVFINSFVPNAPFLNPLKTENRKFFRCFQGVEKGCIENEWVNI